MIWKYRLHTLEIFHFRTNHLFPDPFHIREREQRMSGAEAFDAPDHPLGPAGVSANFVDVPVVGRGHDAAVFAAARQAIAWAFKASSPSVLWGPWGSQRPYGK